MPGSPAKKPPVSNIPFLEPTAALAMDLATFPAASKDQKSGEKTKHKKEKHDKKDSRSRSFKATIDYDQVKKVKQHSMHDSPVKDTSSFEQLTSPAYPIFICCVSPV